MSRRKRRLHQMSGVQPEKVIDTKAYQEFPVTFETLWKCFFISDEPNYELTAIVCGILSPFRHHEHLHGLETGYFGPVIDYATSNFGSHFQQGTFSAFQEDRRLMRIVLNNSRTFYHLPET